METTPPRRKRSSRTRERVEARRRRQDGPPSARRTATIRRDEISRAAGSRVTGLSREASDRMRSMVGRVGDHAALREAWATAGRQAGVVWRQARLWLNDARWYLANNPRLYWGAFGLIAALIVLHFAGFALRGRIFPSVSAAGVGLGGLSTEVAADRLTAAWRDEVQIEVRAEGQPVARITPAQLGLDLDADATARAAREVSFGALPFGREVEPVVALDYTIAQDFLLDLSAQVDVRPFNAGYAWENGEVIGVPGRSGRLLDVSGTLAVLDQDATRVVTNGALDLLIAPLEPEVVDPEPMLVSARAYASGDFLLTGYDPYLNQHLTWPITPDVLISWLQALPTGFTLREDTFMPYLDALNASLTEGGNELRYFSPTETIDAVRAAINGQQSSAELRIRYRQTLYEVVSGDRAYGIARRFGLPYYLLEQANGGKDLNTLRVGDELIIPSPDEVLSLPIVDHKRIVVDLDRQVLVAFENGQVVFQWSISSGVTNAPTSPGVYQILSHEETATGSSVTLCNEAGVECGVWTMNWFMGIYEVVPGLVNGFHGGVLLPNGTYLGGGSVGVPFTFGCIMSTDADAERLYNWADDGTVVEIISSEYAARSELARLVEAGAL